MTSEGAARRTVVVIGGGISGLTAARTLSAADPSLRVIVLEKEETLGGKLKTFEFDGGRVEAGADSFLVREPHVIDLAASAGISDELIEPAIFGGLVWDGTSTRNLPTDAFMGIPRSAAAVWRAENLSLGGKLRALGDLVLPVAKPEGDISVGAFLRNRFGDELTEQMVDPILAGTRSGAIDDMSLRYALPQVFAAAEEGRSVMRALSSNPSGAAPVFNTPRRGMGSLIAAIAGSAPMEIRTRTSVRSLRRASERDWEIHLESGESLQASSVVIALPAHQAAPILSEGSGLSSPAIEALRAMPHASVASIALAYKEGTLTPPPGSSGFLVPSRNQATLAAGTWWSRKWPHTRAEGVDTVRCFVGRTARHPALDLDDDELVRRAAGEISRLTGADQPVASRVDRWDNGLPQFEVGHHERLTAIRAGFEALPGLELAGPDLTGSGIPECVKQAERAAQACLTTALVSGA